MTASVTLLMAIHSHQPVGNFGFVFDEAFAKSYDPFLTVLERHPGVRLALHYSGSLLDWLAAERPEFLARVRVLVQRGQVEMLASGYYEPILPLIPERDRQGQIRMMRQALRARFGDPATGLWLTERVWEPDLPATLAKAGIRYTMLDTNQFAPARPWLPARLQLQDERSWDVLGYYATEHSGLPVFLFPASKRLRYIMPFAQVHESIEFLRRLQRDEPVAITFADDGEKFGLWPKTYQWVYEEGWLDQFFGAVEREGSWLSTTTFRDYAARVAPSGHVYLPGGSYEEMLEWSGGNFRNFFTKYPEAAAMEQKMLRVSRVVAEVSAPRPSRTGADAKREPLVREAERKLYAGQCNCAYWHGVFGGLYLSHLRRAIYGQLNAAERLAGQAAGNRVASLVEDADADGQDELVIRTPHQSVLVDPDEGGTIVEWSLYEPGVNLLDTLSRRPEPYHEKLRSTAAHAQAGGGDAPPSIHDALGAKEANLDAHLLYDSHRRSAFIDYAFQSLPSLEEARRSTWTERRLWPSGPFRLLPQPRRGASEPVTGVLTRELPGGGRIRKTVRVPVDEPSLECVYEMDAAEAPVVALEFNVSLRDERYLHAPGEVAGASEFQVAEPGMGVGVRLSIEPAATLYHFPVETVSESEQGMERTYQGLAVICLWSPPPGGSWRCKVRWSAAPGGAPRKVRRARR
jgi:4-alpha-glucanotransferase